MYVIWRIVNNDFYEHIWKRTHLTSLWTQSTIGTFVLFVFIPWQVAKAAGVARAGSTTLATGTVASSLVSGWWGQGIVCLLTLCMIKFKMIIFIIIIVVIIIIIIIIICLFVMCPWVSLLFNILSLKDKSLSITYTPFIHYLFKDNLFFLYRTYVLFIHYL